MTQREQEKLPTVNMEPTDEGWRVYRQLFQEHVESYGKELQGKLSAHRRTQIKASMTILQNAVAELDLFGFGPEPPSTMSLSNPPSTDWEIGYQRGLLGEHKQLENPDIGRYASQKGYIAGDYQDTAIHTRRMEFIRGYCHAFYKVLPT